MQDMQQPTLFTPPPAACGTCGDNRKVWDAKRGEFVRCPSCKPLPTRAEAAQEMQEAVKHVHEAADPSWLEDALQAVKRTAEEMQDFISDDVWERGLEQTKEDRALGPVFQRAKRNGWIEKTDRVRPSKRSHLSGKPVWRSLLHGRPR